MFRRAKVTILMLMLTLGVLVACERGEIPPCTPVEGSDVEPCEEGTGRIGNPTALVTGPAGSDGPLAIEAQIEGTETRAAHLVVRATYLPGTVRCTAGDTFRSPPFVDLGSGELMLRCFSDIRVNEYIVGTGPPTLTVMIASHVYDWPPYPPNVNMVEVSEDYRRESEFIMINGGQSMRLFVEPGGLSGREKILFLGLSIDYGIEAFQVRGTWDLVLDDDGNAMVYHPWRDYWIGRNEGHRSKVEWTLANFKAEAVAANTARNQKYSGRVANGTQYPRVISNAANLHQAYVDTGAVNHPDGPPETSLPPPCGKAVPNQTRNPDLMLDCFALLAAKDELRGTGTLNWSVDTAIGSWDGVTTSGTASGGASGASGSTTGSQVTKVELANKGLTGSVPEELEELDLEVLKLSGNSLTGCIPVDLKDVPTNDLADLSLLYCSPPAPAAPTAATAGKDSVPLSWAAAANTSAYRVEYRKEDAAEWTMASSEITTTSYSVTGLSCGTAYLFRLSAKGSGTVYAGGWSAPSASVRVSTGQCGPVFGQETYAFSVAENASQYSVIGTVAATDADGDTPTYHITAGNGDGKFSIDANAGFIVVRGTLDYETTSSYTLTVEARDGKGGVDSATVTITVTDVAE